MVVDVSESRPCGWDFVFVLVSPTRGDLECVKLGRKESYDNQGTACETTAFANQRRPQAWARCRETHKCNARADAEPFGTPGHHYGETAQSWECPAGDKERAVFCSASQEKNSRCPSIKNNEGDTSITTK